MKKLLLLTLLPLTAFLSSYAGKNQQADSVQFPITDSLVINALNDPKADFRNLIHTVSASGLAVKMNPKAISFVEDYMEDHTGRLNQLKSSGKRYLDLMDQVFTKYGLPIELKYLSVIESQLKATALSHVGARGPWQFMPATARGLGLKVSGGRDERTDYNKSTHAAARYLTQLYGMFNDWLLVIAAYNGGPGVVNKAIRKSGSRNFWSLQNYLPAESRNHVKKFIATHYIMEGCGGITTLTEAEAKEYLAQRPANVVPAAEEGMEVIPVSGKYSSAAIAKNLDMSLTEFNTLNPSFDQQLSVSGTYYLKLPQTKAPAFKENKPQILEDSIRMLLASAAR
jgi:membrane-bound lytic murein transglycosylase D